MRELLWLAGLFGSFVYYRRRRRRLQIERFEEGGKKFGFKLEQGSLVDPSVHQQGEVDGIKFEAHMAHPGVKRPLQIIATVPLLPMNLLLKSEGTGTAVSKLVEGGDLQIGDEDFDKEVVIRGDEHTARALLDATTRAQVRAALKLGIWVQAGQLHFTQSIRLRSSKDMEALFETMLALARSFNPGNEDERTRLLRIAQTEPIEAVALGALRSVCAQDPLNPAETQSLLRHPESGRRLAFRPWLGPQASADRSDLGNDLEPAHADRFSPSA